MSMTELEARCLTNGVLQDALSDFNADDRIAIVRAVLAEAGVAELVDALKPFARASAMLSALAPDGLDDGLTVGASICARPEREWILSTADFSAAFAALVKIGANQ